MNRLNDSLFTITKNEQITKDTYEMILKGDTDNINNSGEFINILIDNLYLRRPISICDYSENTITIVYKVIGKGTEILSTLEPNSKELQILTGLGNGFTVDSNTKNPLVIGGGVGIAPMYNLTKKLIENNQNPTVILGYASKTDIFYIEEFKNLKKDLNLLVSTADGSYGEHGFVTTIIDKLSDYDYFYACGPEPMLKAISNSTKDVQGQLSFEERMGCGFGACMGCSCETKYGYKRICKEGPVLTKEEVKW